MWRLACAGPCHLLPAAAAQHLRRGKARRTPTWFSRPLRARFLRRLPSEGHAHASRSAVRVCGRRTPLHFLRLPQEPAHDPCCRDEESLADVPRSPGRPTQEQGSDPDLMPAEDASGAFRRSPRKPGCPQSWRGRERGGAGAPLSWRGDRQPPLTSEFQGADGSPCQKSFFRSGPDTKREMAARPIVRAGAAHLSGSRKCYQGGEPINSGSPISPHFQICTQQDPKAMPFSAGTSGCGEGGREEPGVAMARSRVGAPP